MQLVDARDLAAFLLDCGEHGTGGHVQRDRPPGNATMGSWLQDCVDGDRVRTRGSPGSTTTCCSRTRSSRGPSCRCGCRRARTATTSWDADTVARGRGRACAAGRCSETVARHLGLDAGRWPDAARAAGRGHVGRTASTRPRSGASSPPGTPGRPPGPSGARAPYDAGTASADDDAGTPCTRYYERARRRTGWASRSARSSACGTARGARPSDLPLGPGRRSRTSAAALVGYALELARRGTTCAPRPRAVARRAASRQRPAAGGSTRAVGDARASTSPTRRSTRVLLLGPLYHLDDRTDRVRALGRRLAGCGRPGAGGRGRGDLALGAAAARRAVQRSRPRASRSCRRCSPIARRSRRGTAADRPAGRRSHSQHAPGLDEASGSEAVRTPVVRVAVTWPASTTGTRRSRLPDLAMRLADAVDVDGAARSATAPIQRVRELLGLPPSTYWQVGSDSCRSVDRRAGAPLVARPRRWSADRVTAGEQGLEVVGDRLRVDEHREVAARPVVAAPSTTGQPRSRAEPGGTVVRRVTAAGSRTARPASPARPAAARRRSRRRAAAATRPARLAARRPAPARAGRRRSSRGSSPPAASMRGRARRRARRPRRAAGPAGGRPRRAAARRRGTRSRHRRPGRAPGGAEQRQQVARPGVADQHDRCARRRPSRTCSAARATYRVAYGGASSSRTSTTTTWWPRPRSTSGSPPQAAGPVSGLCGTDARCQDGRGSVGDLRRPWPPGSPAGTQPRTPARCSADQRQGRRARPGHAVLRPGGRLLRRPAPDHPRRRGRAAGRRGDARPDRRPRLRRRRRAHARRRPGGRRDAARRRRARPPARRVRRPQGGQGARPAAPHRGPGRRRPPRARRRGHLDDRRLGAHRRRGAARGRAPRSSASP